MKIWNYYRTNYSLSELQSIKVGDLIDFEDNKYEIVISIDHNAKNKFKTRIYTNVNSYSISKILDYLDNSHSIINSSNENYALT